MGGGKVAYYRRQAGLSQTELARRTGLRQSWISDLERGHYDVRNMTLRNAARLAAALHVHAEDLLDDEQPTGASPDGTGRAHGSPARA